ncbi:MAG: NB-ARC domain-containing protein [Chloroflexota bacterium]
MQTQSTAPPPSLKNNVKKALDHWHKPNNGKSTIESLYLFRERLRDTQQNHRRVTNDIILRGIRRLEGDRGDCAAYLQQRYLDEKSVVALAQTRNMSQSMVFDLQKLSIEWLTNTLWDMERAKRQERQERLLKHLEAPTYANLVGVEKNQDALLTQLDTANAPYIVSVTGMGGMGKTALADSLARRVIAEGQFDEVGWVTARQQQLNFLGQIELVTPSTAQDNAVDIGGDTGSGTEGAAYESNPTAEGIVRELCRQVMPDFPLPTNFSLQEAIATLEKHLNQYPHLIVIDNLETVEDIRDLFPTLHRLANPSKFLLTSREELFNQANIFHYNIPALNEAESLALVRQEAIQSNLPVVAESTDDELKPIYDTVGGNPLALRLVVGLVHHELLDDILDDLRVANNKTADQLYTYIYRQAWDKLNELSRQILLTMPTIKPSGDGIDIVIQNSGLDRRAVRAGLSSLVILNLVNTHGDQADRRYSIHALTKSFLLEQVLLWS